MSKVTVYSTPTCKYCVVAKDFLKENGVEFEEVNVSEDADKKKEMIEKSGQLGVPVITIDDKVIVGFSKDELTRALDLK